MLTGFIWLRMRACSGLFWTWQYSFGFHKRRGISMLEFWFLALRRRKITGFGALIVAWPGNSQQENRCEVAHWSQTWLIIEHTSQIQRILLECLLLTILMSLLEKQITRLTCWYQNNRKIFEMHLFFRLMPISEYLHDETQAITEVWCWVSGLWHRLGFCLEPSGGYLCYSDSDLVIVRAIVTKQRTETYETKQKRIAISKTARCVLSITFHKANVEVTSVRL